jgi:hypothetical protein
MHDNPRHDSLAGILRRWSLSKRGWALSIGTIGLLFAPFTARAAIEMNIHLSTAPQVFGSPNYTPWVNNMLDALKTGSTTFGTPGTPAYYYELPSALPDGLRSAILTTPFNSWLGTSPPEPVYGAAFSAELGNRVVFNLHVKGTGGTRFRIGDLGIDVNASDGDFGGGGFGFEFPAGSFNYSAERHGLDYGPDQAPGGGDDVLITGGANTQIVDELFMRGSGTGYVVDSSAPGATNQEKIDNFIATKGGVVWATATYTLLDTTGGSWSESLAIGLQEPGSLVLLSVAGVLVLRRRRLG